MYRIALVEDEKYNADRFCDILNDYSKKEDVEFQIRWYCNAITFLEEYGEGYDIVFMDIRMPVMDGMEAARKLRERDSTVVLVFLTALAQYAIQGYEVQAADYILKPVNQTVLEMKLKRLLPRCRRNESTIALDTDKNKVFLQPDELLYVEIYDHHIHYQTTDGVLRSYGTLKQVEEKLPKNIFYRINNQTIINLRHVTRMDTENVYLGEREFPISMRRRKGFIEALHLSKTGG